MSDDALTLTITQAGQAAIAAAQLADGAAGLLTIATLGLTDAAFVVAPTLTALPGRFRLLDTLSGAVTGPDTVHLVLRDDEGVTYGARGFGLYLTDGTLFAVYGQADRLFEKSVQVSLMVGIDVAFPIAGVDHLAFGDANWLNPLATADTAGVLAIASQAEVEGGTVATKAVTPLTLATRLAEVVTSLLAQIAHAVADYIPLAQRGVAGGVAQLDGGGKVPSAQLALATADDAAVREDATRPVTSAALGGAAYLRVTDAGSNANGTWRATSDGTLEQEGEVDTADSGSTEPVITVTLPKPFPDANYRVSLTPGLTAAANDKDTWVQVIFGSKTPTSFDVQYQRPGTSETSFGLNGFEWTARRRSI